MKGQDLPNQAGIQAKEPAGRLFAPQKIAL